MRILHTADLHLGQVIYQNYGREDEHRHFFRQLKSWCIEYHPDALLVCGDVFDLQQPGAGVRQAFADVVAEIHGSCPSMKIVIVAGNHDSASRIQSDRAVWKYANAVLSGAAPSLELLDSPDGWQDDYIVEIPEGFIIAVPYMPVCRKELFQSLLDRVAAINVSGKPVVMTGHLAVTGSDFSGHGFDIGNIKTNDSGDLGSGYDYLALGHIHKPQTVGHKEESYIDDITLRSGVIRYSGSALHVSCDETYPHSVSLVDIDRRGGNVRIRQLRINQLRHFFILPEDGTSFQAESDALEAVREFAMSKKEGYIRLRIDSSAQISPDFNQKIYDMISVTDDAVRYNPKVIWTGSSGDIAEEPEAPRFEVADLQQMEDPVGFVERTIRRYPGLGLDEIREAFSEVAAEVERMKNESN
ncbi:MAG: exonuclease SbcCD subunit D [Candidatus Cryptobacteroides sp.]|nr:exonuclease SbcCD subunit D [Bacteroidales bacterium]